MMAKAKKCGSWHLLVNEPCSVATMGLSSWSQCFTIHTLILLLFRFYSNITIHCYNNSPPQFFHAALITFIVIHATYCSGSCVSQFLYLCKQNTSVQLILNRNNHKNTRQGYSCHRSNRYMIRLTLNKTRQEARWYL